MVLLPVIVSAPAPPLFTAQFHVEPPPANVFVPAFVKVIVPVPVPAVVVNPVGELLVIPEPVCSQRIVPPLNVMFFVPVSVESCAPGIKVWPFKLSVPFVSLKVRVDPKVKLSKSWNVPPAPFIVTGKSKVLPEVVMVFVPLVAPMFTVPVPEAKDIPVDNVKLPKIVDVPDVVNVPAYPVKLTFLTTSEFKKAKGYVPAVNSQLIAFASVKPLILVLMAFDPVYDTRITGVPVTVRLIPVAITTNPCEVRAVTTTVPVPAASVAGALDPMLACVAQVKVLLFKFNVPCVRLRFADVTRESARTTVPPGALTSIDPAKTFPVVVNVCVPRPKQRRPPSAPSVTPDPMVKLP